MKLTIIQPTLLFLVLSTVSSVALAFQSEESIDIATSTSKTQSKWQQKKSFSSGFLLAKTYYKSNQYKDALALSEEIFQLKDLTIDQQAQTIIFQSQVLIKLKQYEQQDKVVKRAARIMGEVKSNAIKIELLSMLGKLQIMQFKLPEAQAYYLQAIEQSEDKTKLATVYEELGITYAQQGKFPLATEAMLTSVKTFEGNNEPVPLSLYNNLGGLSLYLQDWDKAISYLQLVIENIEGDTQEKSDAYLNLGNAYFYKNEKNKALNNYKIALEITDALGKENPEVMNNYAYLLLELGNEAQALSIFRRAEALYLNNGDEKSLGIAKKNIGETYVALGESNKAAEYFEQAYDIYIKSEYIPKLLELYPIMIENYKVIGNLSRALSLSIEFKSKNDEAVSVESKTKIAELESAFELAKKNKELAESQKELADLAHEQAIKDKNLLALKLTKQNQEKSIYLLGVIVFVLGLAGFFLIRINRLRVKVNAMLLQKNDEIERNHSQLKKLNTQLEQQSLEDTLTELKNRRFVEQFLLQEESRLKRELTSNTLSPSLVIMLDIDNFKQINDTYGHAIGDEALKVFASVLKSNARSSDIQVRWGGEEFLWYCPQTSLADGEHLCERLREHLQSVKIKTGSGTISPRCSFGFTTYPMFEQFEQAWEGSLKVADAALYRAKSQGRDRWVGAELSGLTENERATVLDIDSLIDNGKLTFIE